MYDKITTQKFMKNILSRTPFSLPHRVVTMCRR